MNKLLNFITRPWRNSGNIAARYEAAWGSVNRTVIQAPALSARYDIDTFSRVGVLAKVRFFEKESPIVQKILDLMEVNVVGAGINPSPTSESEDFNKESLRLWNQSCEMLDATSRQHFYQLQSIIVRAVWVDGDFFLRLTTSAATGRPRVQGIEAHRVLSVSLRGTPHAGKDIVDGVILDSNGRPEFYCVSVEDYDHNQSYKGRVEFIPADEMVHFFEPSRAGQYRGISIFHSCINTLHDLDDLQRFEMIAAKDAASKSFILKVKGGEANSRALYGEKTFGAAERTQYYQRTLGGNTTVVDHQDSIEQSPSNRPTVTTQAFWEYLTDHVCKGVGISFAALQDYRGEWGGAAMRGTVACDNRFYEIRTLSLKAGLDRVWRHVIGGALRDFAAPIPSDWTSVQWQPPRRTTVDIGRDSKATREDIAASITTLQDVLGERGLDYRAVMRQRAKELALQAELEAEYGLQAGTLSSLVTLPDPVPEQAQIQPPKQAKPPTP